MKLFEGDDDDVEKLSKIEINKEFARRFEHNKKREDLQRFEELKKKGLVDEDDSSDESEDDDDDDEDFGKPISEKDAEFFNALIKIRNKDPILQNKDAKLFESESESEPDSEADDKKKEKAKKKMYLKDVSSKHLIEEGPEFNDEDEEEDKDKMKVKTYSEEQEELRKEFLDSVEKMEMENEQDGEDFFKVKERDDEDVEDDDDAEEFSKKLDEYFGEDDKLDENDRFLKDYFRNKMWMNSDEKVGKEDDVGFEFSEDEEEIEKQEDYERDFNFRFEENAGDRVWGHSRKVEGSVRKKTNARKSQRERKEERMAKEEDERKEELKRLKNLKKKEMREKLQKIKETAGIGDDGVCLLDEDDLEEEFNPEEYDKKMKKAFGEAYYETEDVNPDFGSDEDADEGDLEKPDFDKEDELLGLPKGWDEMNQPREGFLSVRERILKSQENTGEEHETVDEEDGVSEEGKRKKKRRKDSVVMQAAKDQLMEEYYKLDYEDAIGDLKTRFKYKPVNAKRFGLSTEEMLILDDKELNQYVPLKTLAPYRDKDWKVPRAKRHQQKQKIKELIQGKTLDIRKNEKKRPRDQETTIVANYTENEKPHLEGSNGDTSTLSRKKRRKMRLAELKTSHRRLLAFGFNKKK
nr:protein KRI1 homolog [Ipomoea batatas]